MDLNVDVSPEELRTMLRIRHDKLDAELQQLKAAYLSDIALCGVKRIPVNPALALSCLRLYLRWQEIITVRQIAIKLLTKGQRLQCHWRRNTGGAAHEE